MSDGNGYMFNLVTKIVLGVLLISLIIACIYFPMRHSKEIKAAKPKVAELKMIKTLQINNGTAGKVEMWHYQHLQRECIIALIVHTYPKTTTMGISYQKNYPIWNVHIDCD